MRPSFGSENGGKSGDPGLTQDIPERPETHGDEVDNEPSPQGVDDDRVLGDPSSTGDHDGIPGSGHYPY